MLIIESRRQRFHIYDGKILHSWKRNLNLQWIYNVSQKLYKLNYSWHKMQ